MHVLRHLLGERQQRGADSGVVLQRAEDVAEFFRRHIRLLRQGEDDPLLAHPPERNFHALSGGERHAVRNAVGKRMRDVLMHNVHNYLCVQDTHPFLAKCANIPLFIIHRNAEGVKEKRRVSAISQNEKSGRTAAFSMSNEKYAMISQFFHC